jgi:hypothetical protein
MKHTYYGPNLFEEQTVAEALRRVDLLTVTTQRQWGKMNVAQMLAHCAEVFEVSNGHKKAKLSLLGRTIGPLFKFVYTNKKPLARGAPTSKEFEMVSEKDFHIEQNRLKSLVKEFLNNGPEKLSRDPHPFFGKLTPDQWSRGMYKHLDHHLRQFGV